MVTPKIPDPPLLECCDAWVESYRVVSPFTGLPLVHYECVCVCGQADVDLSVVGEGKSRRSVWGVPHTVGGVNKRELIASWEQAGGVDLSGFADVPAESVEAPAVDVGPSGSRAVPPEHMGKAAREQAARDQAERTEQAAREPVFR